METQDVGAGKTDLEWLGDPFLGIITQPHSFHQATGSLQLCPYQDVEQHCPWMEQAHGIEQGWRLIFQLQSPSLLSFPKP